MGGRSGQSIKDTNSSNATQEDYDIARFQKYNYGNSEAQKNLSIEDKTIYSYTNMGYEVNNQIYKGKVDKYDEAYIRNLDKSLEKEPIFKGVVYRGVQGGVNIEDYKKRIGKNIVFETYTSSSKTKDVTNQFGSDKTLFIIKSKKGRDISSKSAIKSENEILFKRNSKFKVTKVEGNTIYLNEQ